MLSTRLINRLLSHPLFRRLLHDEAGVGGEQHSAREKAR
jgi:hypothetical protein